MNPLDFIDHPRFDLALKNHLKQAMTEATEPFIKKACEDAERAIRKAVGAYVVEILEEVYTMERFGNDLRITVRHVKP